jgi:outer membrane protein OmpA-like peptidoglycan-associated protein
MYIQTISGLGQAATAFDVNKAIRNNRIYGQTLGWRKYYDSIIKFLGFTAIPNETEFAQAVALSQKNQGLHADGVIGPATWKIIQSALVRPSSTAAIVTTPDVVIPGKFCEQIFDFDFDSSKLKPEHSTRINSLAKRIVESYSTTTPIRTVYAKGHTDPVGKEDYNQALGMRRALTVRKELMKALDRIQKNISFRVLILASSRGAKDAKLFSEDSKQRRVEVCLSSKQLLARRPKPAGTLTIPPQIITGKIINWDEKFERHFDNCCASEQLRRMPCSLLIGVRGGGGIKFTSCNVLPRDWRTVFPEDIRRMIEECCKSGSDRETTVDNCVLVGVLAEISEELGGVSAETAKQIEPKYREWKSRSNKTCI